jgi:hypothetical protein
MTERLIEKASAIIEDIAILALRGEREERGSLSPIIV